MRNVFDTHYESCRLLSGTGFKNSDGMISPSYREKVAFASMDGEPVAIPDENTDYKIILIDPGFCGPA